MPFPQLTTLGIAEADIVCQDVVSHTKPTPGPAGPHDTLTVLGVPDAPAVIILVNRLVATAKAHKATLDPGSLSGLTPGSTYGTMLVIVAMAPRDEA